MSRSGTPATDVDRHLVEAFLTASRVLVAVAARSLAAGNAEITLAQHRALVVLASRGPQRIADLAELLDVNSSNATRNCDRLQRRGLVRRDRDTDDRRAVRVSLTPAGEHLVQQITAARATEISRILGAMPGQARGPLLAALRAFTDAAGEAPEQSWSLGWGTDPAPPAALTPDRQGTRP
ncbi:MarR family winged helix-turn-helix transcriptional regulator [Actinoplanes sp. N902-109]|uniref:MarR family winged helix-turn-helix transcriptional regulator n=1 Tax=Actinoplanes sp. (strain N902-109) TaxID=649831 RepID=UPI00032946A8|nr:MarR family transcriptional regulator [Actinoplanes sp. N902-109]AGL16270.1 EstGX1 [Actinoplanes sp. N902-109]